MSKLWQVITALVVIRRPPGVTWEFLRVPVQWAILVAWLYLALLMLVWAAGGLTLGTALAAGEVFVAIAGLGAAVVAIGGVAKAFSVPKPVLELSFFQLGDLWDASVSIHRVPAMGIDVQNYGDEPAYGVEVVLIGIPEES